MHGDADEIELPSHVAIVRVVGPWMSATEVERPIVLHVVGSKTEGLRLRPGHVILVGRRDRIRAGW